MRYEAVAARSALLAATAVFFAAPGSAEVSPSAEEPPPAIVALTLDTSGSVGAAQLMRARDLALAILAALPAGSEVAVLAFDDQSRVVVPRTSRPDDVRRRLVGLKVGGRYTALHDALYDASRYVRDVAGARKAIVLITDGIDENSALNLEDGLRIATEAQIPVYAVGVGARPQERVLRRIAKLTGGDYVAFDRARGTEIAARIAAAPAVAASSRAAGTVDNAPAGGASRLPLPPSAAVRGPSSSASAARSGAWLVWIALALTATVAGAVLLLARRQRPGPAATPPPPATPLPPSTAEPDLSPTVLARMNMTEEYLERTITLQERPVLAVTRGPAAGQVFELSATSATSIGRSRANDIQVEDVSISGQHCRIRPEEGGFVLHDLKSTNGTLVNEKKVARHVLEEGDVIRIGETALQYRREMKRG